MSYSGAIKAKEARESLGRALAALQEDPNIPPDVLAVAQHRAPAAGPGIGPAPAVGVDDHRGRTGVRHGARIFTAASGARGDTLQGRTGGEISAVRTDISNAR